MARGKCLFLIYQNSFELLQYFLYKGCVSFFSLWKNKKQLIVMFFQLVWLFVAHIRHCIFNWHYVKPFFALCLSLLIEYRWICIEVLLSSHALSIFVLIMKIYPYLISSYIKLFTIYITTKILKIIVSLSTNTTILTILLILSLIFMWRREYMFKLDVFT